MRTCWSSCISAKFTQRNAVRAVSLPKKTERSAEKSCAKKNKRRSDKHVCPEIPKCDGCCDAGRAHRPGQWSSGLFVAFFISFRPRISPFCLRALFCFEARGADARAQFLLHHARCISEFEEWWSVKRARDIEFNCQRHEEVDLECRRTHSSLVAVENWKGKLAFWFIQRQETVPLTMIGRCMYLFVICITSRAIVESRTSTEGTLCPGRAHTEVVGELNPAVLHVQQCSLFSRFSGCVHQCVV